MITPDKLSPWIDNLSVCREMYKADTVTISLKPIESPEAERLLEALHDEYYLKHINRPVDYFRDKLLPFLTLADSKQIVSMLQPDLIADKIFRPEAS